MEGAKEVFCALFRLMKAKELLTIEEYEMLVQSTEVRHYNAFVDVVNTICKED